MPQPDTASRFRTTHWSLIVRARANSDDLEALLREYWNPIYAYVRRCGFGQSNADDITQQFIAQVVMERDLVGKADPARGRFRGFVKKALHRFIIDHVRKAGQPTSVDPQTLEAVTCSHAEAECEFDRQFAANVLTIAAQRAEVDCRESGLEQHWIAFESRLLRPSVDGARPTSLDDLRRQFSAETNQKVSTMIQVVQRKIRAAIREVVGEIVAGGEDIEDEYQFLLGLLEKK